LPRSLWCCSSVYSQLQNHASLSAMTMLTLNVCRRLCLEHRWFASARYAPAHCV
jgi:hypothetical protein